MDLWTIIKVVIRRWYVVLPILVLTAVVAYQVAYKAPPSYQASGSALLVAPNATTGVTGLPVKQNPYLLFSGSLNITASALVRILNDTAVRDELIKADLRGDYEIGVEQSTPTIGVTASGPTADSVVGTVRRLLDEVSVRLRNLQNTADAPSDLRIGVELLVNPSTAVTVKGKVARTMATIGALGLLAGVAMALLWEAAVSARRRSKAERQERRLEEDRTADSGGSAERPQEAERERDRRRRTSRSGPERNRIPDQATSGSEPGTLDSAVAPPARQKAARRQQEAEGDTGTRRRNSRPRPEPGPIQDQATSDSETSTLDLAVTPPARRTRSKTSE